MSSPSEIHQRIVPMLVYEDAPKAIEFLRWLLTGEATPLVLAAPPGAFVWRRA